MEGTSNSDLSCDGECVFVNPHEKLMLLKSSLQPLNIDLPHNSDDDNSSVVSLNEGCQSPLSSWDSEPETDVLSIISSHGMPVEPLEGINMEECLEMEQENLFVGVENIDDNLSWEIDNKSYDQLLKKFKENEEELRVSNFKLNLSEQEIIKLKVQVENSEGQLDKVREELKLNEEELHKQKELSEEEMAKWAKELRVANEQLKISKFKIAKLEKELGSKSSKTRQLQDQLNVTHENLAKSECQLVSEKNQIQFLTNQLVSWRNQIKMLKDMYGDVQQRVLQKFNSCMLDLEAKHSLEKDELIKKWSCKMSEMEKQLTSKLEDCESRNSTLENKLRQYEAEKVKIEELNATQQMALEDEICYLREELGQRKHDVEAAKKGFDMLMIERDEDNVKIAELQAQIWSHEDEISNMKRYIRELKVGLKELEINKTTLDQVNHKLTLRVGELRKEIIWQNGVISDRDEEKREAIRQLCFSLDHYRSLYLRVAKRVQPAGPARLVRYFWWAESKF